MCHFYTDENPMSIELLLLGIYVALHFMYDMALRCPVESGCFDVLRFAITQICLNVEKSDHRFTCL